MKVTNDKNIVEYEEYCDNMVRQSNFLIEATSMAKLSLNGRKYFELMSSMVNRENEEEDNPFYFRCKDLMKLFGIKSRGSAYTEFARVTKELMSRVIAYRPDNNNKKLSQRPLLSMADHDSANGIIGSKIHIDIKPHLKSLKDNFAEYKLQSIMGCKSNYAITLYKLAKMYGDNTEFTIDLEQLKVALDATSYERTDNFRRIILDIAIKEINSKTDIDLSYEIVKEGRKVSAIKFESKKKDNITESDFSADELNEIIQISEIINLFKKNTNGADISQNTLSNLIQEKGTDVVKYYAENMQCFITEGTRNIQGLFIDAVKKHGTDKQYTKIAYVPKTNKIPQATNFKQREYSDEEYESLYENV
jgi:plasmid replication initiation protein